MIDQVSNKGFAEVSAPATVNTTGAGSGVLNLLTGPGGTGAPNAPTNGQPQGTIAFVLDSTVLTGAGTSITKIQTSANNSSWADVTNGAFTAISNVANTAGLQVVYIDSAVLSQYNRAFDTVSAGGSTVRTVTAFFVPKNP